MGHPPHKFWRSLISLKVLGGLTDVNEAIVLLGSRLNLDLVTWLLDGLAIWLLAVGGSCICPKVTLSLSRPRTV